MTSAILIIYYFTSRIFMFRYAVRREQAGDFVLPLLVIGWVPLIGEFLTAALFFEARDHRKETPKISEPAAPAEPPDPATVPKDQWQGAVMARAALGLKPWPNLPDNDYLNSVIGVCCVCNRNIYGGMDLSMGNTGWYCYQHLKASRAGLDP